MADDTSDSIDQEIQDSLKNTPVSASSDDSIDAEIQQSLKSQEMMKQTRKDMEDFAKVSHDPLAAGQGLVEGVKDIPLSLARPLTWAADKALGTTASKDMTNSLSARNAELEAKYGDNPWFKGGRIGGQIAASAPLMGAAGMAAGVGVDALGVPAAASDFIGGATQNPWGWFPSRATQGAIQGTEVGALTNASSNKDPVDYTLGNAEAGAILNPGFQLASKGVGGLTDFGLNKFAENSDPAAMALSKNLKADGFDSIEQAHQKLQEMGPDATWADLGPNTRDFLASTARMQGSPKKQALDFVENRQMGNEETGMPGQSSRLISSLSEELGVDTNYDTLKEQLEKAQSEASSPLYKDAYKANQSISSPELDRILATPAGQKALNAVSGGMQNSGTRVGIPDAELTEQAQDAGINTPKGGVASGLKLETLDKVKQYLDAETNKAWKQAVSPSGESYNTFTARQVGSTRDDLVKELDRLDSSAAAGPNSTKAEGGLYNQARGTWRTFQKQLDALDAGREFMSTGSSDNEALFAKMSPEEKAAARVGAVEGLKDAAANTSNSADIASRMFRTPEKQARFKALFDDPQSFSDFKNHVTNEQELHKLYHEIKGNSRTAGRQAVDENPIPGAVGALTDVATGNHGNLFMRALNRIGAPTQMTPQTAMESSNLMLGPTNEAAARLKGLGAAGFGQRSFLPAYVKMLAGAYGIPATEMGMNAFSSYSPSGQKSE